MAQSEMLIVEDLMLLLMDDEMGIPAGAGTLYYTLGGAVLTELALLGRVEADERRSGLNGPRVRALPGEPPADPLLRNAYEKVAEKERGVQTLLIELGTGLQGPLVDRLVERGLVRREERKVLGLFRSTRFPAADAEHEAQVRRRIRAVLVDGEEPDPRTAALVALLSASGTLPALRPALAWSGEVYRRAKAIEQGQWGAQGVDAAITRTAAAIAAGSAATAVTVATTT